MNERTTLEIIAPTVEEAIQQGLTQLGLNADAVSVEVLDSGTKGLFGLGGRQVRVLLTVNPPEDETSAKSLPPARADRKPAPPKKAESTPRPSEAKPRRPEPTVSKKAEETRPSEPMEHDEVLDKTEEVVSKLIAHMGMEAQVSAHYDDSSTKDRRSIQVDVRGDDLAGLIGRQAQTLAAFQHVASLIVGKQTGQWVQLTVDVEGYRARREKQLKQLANRMADQVTKTGKTMTMEPMPSSERRVVHIELRGHPSVMTESTGSEPYRKVVILPKE